MPYREKKIDHTSVSYTHLETGLTKVGKVLSDRINELYLQSKGDVYKRQLVDSKDFR